MICGFHFLREHLKVCQLYTPMNYQKLSTEGVKHITQIYGGSIRNVLLGASACYAIEQENYIHIPLIFFVPSVYSGYHLFKKREEVKTWLKDFCPKGHKCW